jgi:hypothetical protein
MKYLEFYRLRHKPTGLYYKPKRKSWDGNLSRKGKVYTVKPSLNHVGLWVDLPTSYAPNQAVVKTVIECMGADAVKERYGRRYIDCTQEDWEITKEN